MLDTVLHLSFLNDKSAMFIGDSSDTEQVKTPFGDMENEYRYPSIQVSREMWETAGRPVTIRVKLEEYLEPPNAGQDFSFDELNDPRD